MRTPFNPKNVPGHYVLVGKTPVAERDLFKWATWIERADRCVARTELPTGIISTIFLGLDHGFGMSAPVLFETMSFIGDESEDYFGRYSTWEEAEAGHAEIVARALADIEHTAVAVAELLVPGGEPK